MTSRDSLSVPRAAGTGLPLASRSPAPEVETPPPDDPVGTGQFPATADKARQILNALEISVPQVKPPAAYGVAMGALAVCLVLLPVAYLG